MTAACTSDLLGRFIHDKGSRLSYLRSPLDEGVPTLASRPGTDYNGDTKSKSFRTLASEHPSLLAPLLQGKSVTLLMTFDAGNRTQKKRVAPQKPVPVVIIPGPLFGSSLGSFLIAVVGRGSAVVHPYKDARTASLVLAGIPSKLAKAIYDEFRRIV